MTSKFDFGDSDDDVTSEWERDAVTPVVKNVTMTELFDELRRKHQEQDKENGNG